MKEEIESHEMELIANETKLDVREEGAFKARNKRSARLCSPRFPPQSPLFPTEYSIPSL